MTTASEIKRKQMLTFGLAVGGVVFVIFILVWLSSDSDETYSNKPTKITQISTATTNLDNESIWIEKSETLLENLKKQDKDQSHEIAELKRIIKDQQETLTQERNESKNQFNDFLTQIERIKEQPQQVVVQQQATPTYQQQTPQSQDLLVKHNIGITKGTLSLTPKDTRGSDKHISHYIPAGSHVKAVILGGVDASAAVSAQSDPKPVLLRLMDKGNLPNHHFGNLKDCHITAAAFGDVSSERALMRLETISCVNDNGDVFESKVSGYVAGEDGITGVRGQIVHRERQLLNHSLVSGLLSGLGKSVESKFSSVTQSPIGTTSTIANDDLLKSSVAKGASNALDRYAEYHIERAEQYQPTIQIGAGRMVDVVFTRGWSLKDVKPKKEKSNG